jgi:hypothetical protein
MQLMLQGEAACLAETRRASAAAPSDFRAASAYAVRLLRVLEQRRLITPSPATASEEAELPLALGSCERAASTPAERDTAEGLRLRATVLLRE